MVASNLTPRNTVSDHLNTTNTKWMQYFNGRVIYQIIILSNLNLLIN
jgi:hypothetical protein